MEKIDIKGWEEYQITDDGRVWSKKTNKWLKLFLDMNGYLYVKLYSKGLGRWKKIHRLVAETFIPNPEGKPCIDHINTLKTDNRVENLRWCTYEENANNPITLGKYKERKGDKHPMKGKHHTAETKRKLSEYFKGKINKKLCKKVYQYTIDNKLIKIWDSTNEAARKLGFSQGNIASCCEGKRKQHKGYKWSYKPL